MILVATFFFNYCNVGRLIISNNKENKESWDSVWKGEKEKKLATGKLA